MKLTFKEEWYFLKQDILTYLIATLFYTSLCLIKEYSIQSVVYGMFECLVFYVPFWIIRMSFCDTYHSDVWQRCKQFTRLTLICGNFVMWILPVRYTLFNGLFASFICCTILYIAALQKKEKNILKNKIKNFENKYNKNIFDMSDSEFVGYCQHKGLDKQDIMLADCLFRKHLKGVELYQAIGYSKAQTIRIRKRLKKTLEI